MKRSLKLLMSALTALIVPTLGWAAVVYTNTLAGEDTSLLINEVAYKATAFTAQTTLTEDDTNKFDTVIYKDGGDNDTQTHTFSMWVKVPTLTDDQILWWVCGGSNGEHGGYAVKAMADGTIRVGKANADGAWNGTNYVTTTDTCLTGGEWAYVTVVVTKTDGERKATPAVYVNGGAKTISGTFPTNLNGGGGTATYAQIGSGISAAGVKVDNTALDADSVAQLYAYSYLDLTVVPPTTEATISGLVNASGIGWDPTLEEGMNATLTADAEAEVAMNAALTLVKLTTTGEKISFVGEETLTSRETIINTNTDVSAISANLGAVTIAENKTLTVGLNTKWTSLSGSGTIKTADTVISLNIAKDWDDKITNATASDTQIAGLAPVPGAAWVNLSAAGGATNKGPYAATETFADHWDGSAVVSLTEEEISDPYIVTYSANNTYQWTNPTDDFLDVYLDDGGSHAQISVQKIPFSEYSVIIYCATDLDSKFSPVTVNGTMYTVDENGVTKTTTAATDTFGKSFCTTAQYATATAGNAIKIDDLSGPLAIVGGGNANGARGGIAAVQIVNTGDIIHYSTIEKTITEDVTYSEMVGADDVATIDLDLTLANDVTLTIDKVPAIGMFTIKTQNASDVVTVNIDLESADDVRAVLDMLDTTDATGIVKTTLGAYTGKAAWMAYEFNGDYTNTGSEGSALIWDGGGAFGDGTGAYTDEMMEAAHTDADENGNCALRLPARPWRDVPAYPAAYTAVMYAKAGTTPNGVLVSFGSATGGQQNTVTLATGANPDKDEMRLVQCGNLQSVATDLVQNLAVPNSQSAYHLYAFAMYTKDGNSRAEVYVDGELLTTYTFDGEIALGTGLQVGSIHGGAGASGLQALAFTKTDGVLTDYDPATMDFIRVYDCLLSEEMIQQMAEDYPYTSPTGTATRELDGTAANWVEGDDPATAWSQATLDADATTTTTVQNAPNNGTNIVLNASAETELTVNLPDETPAYETLTVNGDVTFIADEETETLAVSGRTTINGNVTMPYDLVHLSTVTVKAGNTLTIDASSIDLSKIYTSDTIGLTGLIEKEDDTAKVEITLPTAGAEGREINVLETEAGYSLEIIFTGILEATVPVAGATWSALEWKMGETVIAEENLPEDFAEIPVTLIAEEGAVLTLEENTSLGGLTVQGADLTLSGDYALNVDPATLITTTAIIVDEKAMLDLSEAAAAGLTQKVKGTGTVTVKMTATYDNVITLEGFTGTTAVAAGYFSIDASSVGSTLRLFNGTRVQTSNEAGKTDATLNIVLEGTVQFYTNNDRPYATTGTITGGTLDKQGGATLTAAAITSTLALNVGNVVINPGEGNATTMENPISGSQPLTIASGTVTMTAANGNYGGAITVAEGATLKTTGGNHVPFGTGAITNNGTIDISPSDKSVISGVISGTGEIIVNSETLDLYAANTYTGATTIVAGAALTLGEGASIGAGDLVLNGTLTGSATIAADKTISGTGTITGTLTLADGAIIDATSGALTVSGAVTQNGAFTIDVTGLAADATILTCDTSTLTLENITLSGVAAGLAFAANDEATALVLVAVDDNDDVIVPDDATDEELEAAWAVLESTLTTDQLEALTEITNPEVAAEINGIITGPGTVDLENGVATFTYEFKVSEITFGESGVTVTVELGKNKLGEDQFFATGVTVTLVDLNGAALTGLTVVGTTIEESGKNEATATIQVGSDDIDTLLFKAKAMKVGQTNENGFEED